MNRWIVPVLVSLILPLWATDATAAYKGRVVDAETKEPIEGVVVFMEWDQAHFMSGSTYVGAYETVTDKDGRFSLPRYWSFNLWKTLWASSQVTIFKSGYAPIIGGPWPGIKEEWGLPKGSILWKMEDGKPMILLRRIKNFQELEKSRKTRGALYPGGDVPERNMRDLRGEMDKEDYWYFRCKGNNEC